MPGPWDLPPTPEELSAAGRAPRSFDAPPTAAELTQAGLDPEETRKDDALRTIFDAGLTKAANEHAGVLSVAKQLQVPAALVAERFPEFKRKAEAAQFDPRRFRIDNPELSAFLLERPQLAPVIRDDVANLTGWEYALTGRRGAYELDKNGEVTVSYTPPFWVAVLRDSVHQAELAMRQTLDLQAASAQRFPVVPVAYDEKGKGTTFEAEGVTYNFPPGLEPQKPSGPPAPHSLENTARIEELRTQVPAARDYGIDEIPFKPARAVAHALADVVEFIPAIGGTIGAAVAGGATAGPVGAFAAPFAFNYALSAGPEYDAKRQLLDASGQAGNDQAEDQAVWLATLGGTTNAALMSVGPGKIFRGVAEKVGLARFMNGGAAGVAKLVQNETVGRVLLRGAKQWGTHWAEGVATVAAMGGVSAGTQEAFRSGLTGDDFDVGTVGQAMWTAGKDAAVSLAILSATSMPVRQYLEEIGRARSIDRNAGRLQKSVEAARASKTVEHLPEEAADLVGRMARAGDAETVFVEKAEFDRLYQEKGVSPREVAAAFLGDGGKAWDQANATGADLPIPTGIFLTKVARTAEGLQLTDIARLPQDPRTPRQTREVAARVGRKVREQAEAAAKAGGAAPQEVIRSDFMAKAVAAGRSKLEAETSAEVVARAFTWFGAETGRDPVELYRTEVPLTMRGPGQAAAATLLPEASKLLTARFDTMSPAERAREYFIDRNTGILNERAFRALPADPERPLVAQISVEGTKWLNTKDHDFGDQLYAAAARALHGIDPEAAKVGGDFAIRVKDQAQLDQVLARLNKAQPVAGFSFTGAVGPDLAAAAASHVALKAQLEASGARAVRGERPLGVTAQEPGQVAFPAERAAAAVPAALEAQHGALAPAEAFRAAYVEASTGVLTAEGWNAIPRKEHLAALDLNGLKHLNDRLGTAGGDEALAQLATLARLIGGERVDFAHLHGDEFAAQHSNPAVLQAFVDRLSAMSENVRWKVRALDGTLQEVQGLTFGKGIGRTNADAEAALAKHKLELTAAGKRGPEADARRLRPVADDVPGAAGGRDAGGDVAGRGGPLARGRGPDAGRAGAQDYGGASGAGPGVAAAQLPEGAVIQLRPRAPRGAERGSLTVQYDAAGAPLRAELHLSSPDRSTLPHETIHWFTEVLQRLSDQPGAGQGLKDNFQVLLKEMGYADPAARAAAAKERRDLQGLAKRTPAQAERLKALVGREEKVSHLWEQFLLEGRAPSRELLPVFARFKSWFTRIYRSIEGVQEQYRQTYGNDLVLTDEVRQVFQRMLAGDAAVADVARQLEAERPMVKLTPEEQAQADALEAESRVRAELDVQRLMVQEEKAADREYMKAERARLEDEVHAELDADKVYRAIGALRGVVAGVPGAIDRAMAVKVFGAEVVDALPKGTVAKDGLPPEVAADFLGFPSAESMVRALAAAEPREARVKREVASRMRELYPALAERPRVLAAVAAERLHDTPFLREGVIRLRAMAREAGVEATAPTARELSEAAETMVRDTRYVDLRPDRFDLAAKGAARRASEAADPRARAAEYETYLFNRALERAAADARERHEKSAAVLQRFTTDAAREKLGKAFDRLPDGTVTQPYLEQVDNLLAAFEFRAGVSRAEVQNRGGQAAMLKAWVEARWADGDQVVVPDSVMAKLERQTHWKELTPLEMEDLRTAVESIAQQARNRSKVRIGLQEFDREKVVGELVAGALQWGRGVPQEIVDNVVSLAAAQAGSLERKAEFMVMRPELLLKALDGHKAGGPWTRFIWDTLSDASYRYYDLVRKSSGEVQHLLRELPAAERARLKTPFTVEGHTYTAENVVAILANTGNESNLSKLVRGMSDERLRLYGVEPWNGRDTLDAILAHATQSDVDLAKKVVAAHESYWSEVEALEKMDSGLAPKKVQGKALKFKGAGGVELEGPAGYYPIIYSRKFKIGKQQVEADSTSALGLGGLFNRAYDAASTPQGHLQARIESYARPFDLTLDALPRKLAMTAKDIAFRMDAKQVYRLLTDDRVMGALHQSVGEEGYNVIVHHLQDAVNDVMLPDAGAGLALSLISRARGAVTQSIFGLNFAQSAQNLADVVGVKAVVPQKYFMAASLRIAKDRAASVERIRAEAPEMRLRADGARDSVQAALRDTFRKSGLGLKWDEAKELMMIPFEATNAMVELPLYQGAKDHAMAPKAEGGLGLGEAEAIRHAQGAVRTLFGGKRTVDLTPIQRDKIMRHFTMFYGWANAQLNLFMKAAGEGSVAWSEGRKAKAIGTIAGAFALLWAKQLASEVLVGRGPTDKEKDGIDAADVGRWVAWRGVMTVPLSVPVVGSMVKGIEGEQSRDLSLTPWLALANAPVQAVRATNRLMSSDSEMTDDDAINLFLAWMQAGGQAAGAPVSQARTTVKYWQTRSGNEGIAEDMYGTLYGPQKSGKLGQTIFGE